MVGIYKFQKLTVYQLALDYVMEIYTLVNDLPGSEKFYLSTQIRRAATSIPLNIADGSTGQTDLEQHRLLGMALRSYLETIACFDLIERREDINTEDLSRIRKKGHQLFMKVIAFRKKLSHIKR